MVVIHVDDGVTSLINPVIWLGKFGVFDLLGKFKFLMDKKLEKSLRNSMVTQSSYMEPEYFDSPSINMS